MSVNEKRLAVLKRIKSLEDSLSKAREYLDTGAHAKWHGFRPISKRKTVDGAEQPPHKDWIKNVYIPDREKELSRAEKILEQFE